MHPFVNTSASKKQKISNEEERGEMGRNGEEGEDMDSNKAEIGDMDYIRKGIEEMDNSNPKEESSPYSSYATGFKINMLLGMLFLFFLTNVLEVINPVFFIFQSKCLVPLTTEDGNVNTNDTNPFGIELEGHLQQLMIDYPVRLMKIFVAVMFIKLFEEVGGLFLLLNTKNESALWKLITTKLSLIVLLYAIAQGYHVFHTGQKYIRNILRSDLCTVDLQNPAEEEMLCCLGLYYQICIGCVFMLQIYFAYYSLSKIGQLICLVRSIRTRNMKKGTKFCRMVKLVRKNGIMYYIPYYRMV